MQILSIGKTDVGLYRTHNEDFFIKDDELGLYIVCDGMGGRAAGEIASENAANSVQEFIKEKKDSLDQFEDTPKNRSKLTDIVKEAVLHACQTVFTLSEKEKKYSGMGTTLTMILIVDHIAAIGHVGDSRLYLQRKGKVFKLSTDHTLVTELLYSGVLTPETAKNHPQSHILTRAVGLQKFTKVDTLLFDLMLQDTFLLCSDGMSNSINEAEELAEILQKDLTEIPSHLIDLAKRRDGTDNITTLILRMETDEKTLDLDEKRSNEIELRLEKLREVYLFNHLTLKELTQVMHITKVTDCMAGEILIQEGQKNDTLYVTLEGKLSVTRSGKEITTLGPGSHVGEMALLNHRPRSATVNVITASRLLFIERQDFYRLIRTEPLIGVKLLWCVSKELSLRLDETNAQFYGEFETNDQEEPKPSFIEDTKKDFE